MQLVCTNELDMHLSIQEWRVRMTAGIDGSSFPEMIKIRVMNHIDERNLHGQLIAVLQMSTAKSFAPAPHFLVAKLYDVISHQAQSRQESQRKMTCCDQTVTVKPFQHSA